MNTFRQIHDNNFMQVDKENFAFKGQSQCFSTPTKSKSFGFNSDPFQSATPFGNRNGETPCHGQFTQTRSIPEHDPDGRKLELCLQEQLKPFRDGVGVEEIMNKIKESFSGKAHHHTFERFESITMLRSLNKHYPVDTNEMFRQFGQEIVKSFESEFTLIQRNILLFIYEALTRQQSTKLEESVIERLIPLIMERSVATSRETRRFARECLKVITSSYICNSSLVGFCHLAYTHKNKKVASFAFDMMTQCMKNLGDQIRNVSEHALKAIFVVLIRTVQQKIPEVIKLGKEASYWLYLQMGNDNFLHMLKILWEEKHITELDAKVTMDAMASFQESSKKYKQESKEFRNILSVTKKISNKIKYDVPVEVICDKPTYERTQGMMCPPISMQVQGYQGL